MSTTDLLDHVFTLVQDGTNAAVDLILGARGTRAGSLLGLDQDDPWERLDAYLDVRDDGAYWQERYGQAVAAYGQDYAEVEMIREFTAIEESLAAHGGRDAVDAYWYERRSGQAKRDLDMVQALTSGPRIRVLPPLPPQTDPVLAAIRQAGVPPQAGMGIPPAGQNTQVQGAPMPQPLRAPEQDIGLSTFGPTGAPMLAGQTG